MKVDTLKRRNTHCNKCKRFHVIDGNNGADCPYCEIDLLKGELEEMSELSKKECREHALFAHATGERIGAQEHQLSEAKTANLAIRLEQQLAQARREGWDQGKAEAIMVTKQKAGHISYPPGCGQEDYENHFIVLDIADAISAMEYKEKQND